MNRACVVNSLILLGGLAACAGVAIKEYDRYNVKKAALPEAADEPTNAEDLPTVSAD